MSRMSASTTLTPWLMFSSVVDNTWRLKRSSWLASSSSDTTSPSSMPEPRSAVVSVSRADAAPIADASRRSVNCISARSARCSGCQLRPWLCA